jgi:peptidoglycan/xylan/chitin deacetylase (PgdA/CDA1 family)
MAGSLRKVRVNLHKVPVVDVLEGGSPSAAPKKGRNDAFSFWKLPEEWREKVGNRIEASQDTVLWHLLERYLPESRRHPPGKLRLYYTLRTALPDKLRYRLNLMIVRHSRRPRFPAWPCETSLIEFWGEWLRESMRTVGVQDGWHIGFWPDGYNCCIVLTHDVESPAGFDRMEAMADIEERLGFRSAWNLPLEQYEIDWRRVDKLRARGFEFGAHGLSHDGKLFRSRRHFEQLSRRLEDLACAHDLRGFRSPSTLRRSDWISEMSFDHDSSFFDSDPYEPQPGGTCSLFPFFLRDVVELPYTLPQDHTLIVLLRRNPLKIWRPKALWISRLGGMILTLVHPDYSGQGPSLTSYEEFLKHLNSIVQAWRALPSEVSAWWRHRAAMELSVASGRPMISGPEADRAVARKLSSEPMAIGRMPPS